MSGGVASMRQGVAIAAAAGTACCCGINPGNCIPADQSPCSCAPGCGFTSGLVRRYSTENALGATTVYSIPHECCCGAGRLAWTVEATFRFYDKGECNGLCLEAEITISGSGTGAGSVSISTRGSTTNCSLNVSNTSTQAVNPACGNPRALLLQAIANITGFGFGLQNIAWLGLPQLWVDGVHVAPTAVTGALYFDCTTYEGFEIASDALGSTNPCAGIMATMYARVSVVAIDCVPTTPTCGACCCGGRCFNDMNSAACAAMGGTFNGVGSVCTPALCPPATGKCCYPDGTCSPKTRIQCEAGGGIYMGDGTACLSRPACPPPQPPPIRGCCFPTTGQCQDLTQAECVAAGGNWSPTEQCFQLNCANLGACCYPDGTCAPATANVCAGNGGIFHAGQTCKTVTCPAGRCCVQSGAGALCRDLNGPDCANAQGIFLGFGTCSPGDVDCVGACCDPNINCIPFGGNYLCHLLGQAFCESQGGLYLGGGTVCNSPNGSGCDDPRCNRTGPGRSKGSEGFI